MSNLTTTEVRVEKLMKRLTAQTLDHWSAERNWEFWKKGFVKAIHAQVKRDARIAKKHKFNVVLDGDCAQHDCADLIADAIWNKNE